jgi:motility quorum-sensing regulator/GCU-specific mRNA interferase toxin
MEKKKPTLDLEEIRRELCMVEAVRMTVTARRTAVCLGIHLQDVVAIVQSIERVHFYKSMTTYGDSTVWQDVYHVPWEDLELYVKFTRDDDGYLILSLKER